MSEDCGTAQKRSSCPQSRPLAEMSIDDELVRAVVDAAPDAIVMIDDGGTIELVNARTEELFGYDRSELIGRGVEALVPEDVRAAHRAHRARYHADPVPRAMGAGMVLQGRRADGTEFPVEISLSPVSTAEGQWILAAVRDVSDRLAVERRSRAIGHALDLAPDGLFILDAESLEFTYVNESGGRMHGYEPEEMIGMTPLDLAPNLSARELADGLAPLLAGEVDHTTFRTTGRRRDGSVFPVEVVVNHPEVGPGQVARPLVVVVRDMTERVRIEQEQAAFRARAEVLDERERFARDLHDEVIGDLFGIALGLQASLGSIADVELADKVRVAVDNIDDVISSIRATIFGMRTAAGKHGGVRERVLRIVDAGPFDPDRRPTVSFEGEVDDLPEIIVEHLLPTIREALTNVAKHAEATSADLHLCVEGGLCVLRVTDDGVGLGTDGYDDGESVGGLGLSNMRARAEALGGRCSIASERNRGAELTWTVPLAQGSRR